MLQLPVPARAQHTASLWNKTARQLQALVRRPDLIEKRQRADLDKPASNEIEGDRVFPAHLQAPDGIDEHRRVTSSLGRSGNSETCLCLIGRRDLRAEGNDWRVVHRGSCLDEHIMTDEEKGERKLVVTPAHEGVSGYGVVRVGLRLTRCQRRLP